MGMPRGDVVEKAAHTRHLFQEGFAQGRFDPYRIGPHQAVEGFHGLAVETGAAFVEARIDGEWQSAACQDDFSGLTCAGEFRGVGMAEWHMAQPLAGEGGLGAAPRGEIDRARRVVVDEAGDVGGAFAVADQSDVHACAPSNVRITAVCRGMSFAANFAEDHAMTCPLCTPDHETLLWHDEFCRVIWVDEAAYPGFCRVILNAHVREMSDLPAADRVRLMQVVFAVEEAVRAVAQPDKINLASLGNMVPHLHWHVIPRWETDRTFPDAIWAAPRRDGKVPSGDGWRELLAERLGAGL